METNTAQSAIKKQLVNEVLAQLRLQETSILKRNRTLNSTYNALYGSGLTDGLVTPMGQFDNTEFNLVRLVPEIMTNQLFGRGFGVKIGYDKTDLSTFDLPAADPATAERNKQEKDQARLLNGRKKKDADIVADAIRAINEDNGGLALFNRGGKMQAWAAFVVIKHWLDTDAKKYNMVVLENPNNFYRAWSNSNFREWDWSAYVSQISYNSAKRTYGSLLEDNEDFNCSNTTGPIWQTASGEDPNDTPSTMVPVIELIGFVPGYAGAPNGGVKKVKLGDEEEMRLLIVGGLLVAAETTNLPQFEMVLNTEEALNPWGRPDVTSDAIALNRSLIQQMRAWLTLAYKSLFPKYMFKGFTALNMPVTTPENNGIPMDPDQSIDLVQQPQTFTEFQRVIEWLTQSFTRVTRIGLVMLNDPSAVSNSNQAMMTGMKPLTDVIEEKQSRWNVALNSIYSYALERLREAKIDKALTEAIENTAGGRITIEWPSVLRKEDNAWQTLWLNLYNAQAISWDTFIEKVGPSNASEELDRLRDNLQDPVTAAALGKQFPLLAQQVIQPPQPASPEMGSGLEGVDAATGTPEQNVSNPMASPDMNTEEAGPVSQPGSGATAIPPDAAAAMAAQRQGA